MGALNLRQYLPSAVSLSVRVGYCLISNRWYSPGCSIRAACGGLPPQNPCRRLPSRCRLMLTTGSRTARLGALRADWRPKARSRRWLCHKVATGCSACCVLDEHTRYSNSKTSWRTKAKGGSDRLRGGTKVTLCFAMRVHAHFRARGSQDYPDNLQTASNRGVRSFLGKVGSPIQQSWSIPVAVQRLSEPFKVAASDPICDAQ